MKTKLIHVDSLGKCNEVSPFVKTKGATFIPPKSNVIYNVHESELLEENSSDGIMFFELAGPREKMFFNPQKVTCGIVTCGGLCPGLNDVIRSLVIEAVGRYNVKKVLGFRYGYKGISKSSDFPPIELTPENVDNIHQLGGTILSSSRGSESPVEMVDVLIEKKINVLFVIGGDGTMKGAKAITEEIKKRNEQISIIAIPKTIDNDINYVRMSFGFQSAVEESKSVIASAHIEAKGAPNGIGLVKLMGRHSGYIAANATLANSDVNYCLIPEVPFKLEGDGGLFDVLKKRLKTKQHAVIVVAEGAGQDLIEENINSLKKDASGNDKLKDIGIFLKEKINQYFTNINMEVNLKYIDPSYIIRSVPANAMDSAYCLTLGQNAVHAAMSGKTNLLIGNWNNHFIHVPIPMAIEKRNTVNPTGRLWKTLMEASLQPNSMFHT